MSTVTRNFLTILANQLAMERAVEKRNAFLNNVLKPVPKKGSLINIDEVFKKRRRVHAFILKPGAKKGKFIKVKIKKGLGFAYDEKWVGPRTERMVAFKGFDSIYCPLSRWACNRLQKDSKFRKGDSLPLYTLHEVPDYMEQGAAIVDTQEVADKKVDEVEEVEFPTNSDEVVQATG